MVLVEGSDPCNTLEGVGSDRGRGLVTLGSLGGGWLGEDLGFWGPWVLEWGW